MSFKMCLYGLLLVVMMTAEMTTAGEFDNCKTFTQIPFDDQNKDPNTLSNLTSRPLGYESETIPFNNPNQGNPCVTVNLNDSETQTIQVLAHAVTGSPNFCVKSNLPNAQPTCQAGITNCKDSAIGGNNKIVKYVFYCEGCETDITFWFRFTVSPSFIDSTGLEFENWCAAQPAEFPNSLIVIPGGSVAPTTPTSGGTCLMCQAMLWLSLFSLAFYML